MVRVLSDGDVARVLDLESLLDVVADAFVKQGAGAVERPPRPHFPVGKGLDGRTDPAGTGLVMPAYIHGEEYYVTKLVGVHEGNEERGLPTVQARIAVDRAETGEAAGYLAGTRITNARTGCIGGLAVRELTDGPVTLGVLGAGTQARWQTRAVAAATDLDSVRIYSPSDSRRECADELASEFPDVSVAAVESPRTAVESATAVITATTATEPVFPGSALAPGTVVVAVGAYNEEMRELDEETFSRADRVFADVPEEVIETGDLLATDLTEADLVPFSSVVTGDEGRRSPDEILVVESVGTAVLDAAAAASVYDAAERENAGTVVDL